MYRGTHRNVLDQQPLPSSCIALCGRTCPVPVEGDKHATVTTGGIVGGRETKKKEEHAVESKVRWSTKSTDQTEPVNSSTEPAGISAAM